jgi:Domain of unknown function (DUF4283)
MARTSRSTRKTIVIVKLEAFPETLEIRRFLERCVVVHVPPSLSKDELDRLLRASGGDRPGFEWIARPYKDGMYLVESPDREWYDRVVVEGRIQLGRRSLTAQRWSRDLDGGKPVIDIWIRITGLPVGMWIQPVFDRLVSDFSRVREIDPKTLSREEKRWARLKVCLADMGLLPDKLVVEINSQFHEVRFEAE